LRLPNEAATRGIVCGKCAKITGLYLPNVTEIEEVRVRDQPGEVVGGSIESTLTFRGFPPWHWRRIRTSNPLERTMRQVR